MRKDQIYVRSARIVDWIARCAARRDSATAHSNLNMLVPLRFLYRPTIDLEMNAIILEHELRDYRAVARFD